MQREHLRDLALPTDERARRAGAGSCSRSSSAAGSARRRAGRSRPARRSPSAGARRGRGARRRRRASAVAARDEHLAAVAGRRDPRGHVDVLADVALVGHERRAGVQADAHADRAGRERLRDSRRRRERARRASGRRRRTRRPACPPRRRRGARSASRITRRCSASASAYASAPSSCSSLVEPSTSVKRNVTVPVGRSRARRDHAARVL